ncbi:hypothetical protein AVEN_5245-1 [Araneus ventricosus]|uniref:Endonuclease/exonuclease/phosphatase domain-containing protein n=1 Tax=Araneus ventricosus TaxID=182803 RepID=A0A4Y2WDW8_ARAVE|nr:hypothetical protein AVEN_1652-1 [Araneus ventricosus]GBO35863.1 hypothetical protein AVEN_5245-1 [Araneus ventricosus]
MFNMNPKPGVVVYSCNANGLINKVADLREFLARTNSDVVLLQETHLSGVDKCLFANYVFYSTLSRTHFRRRGTGILIKNTIPHYHLPNPTLRYVETTIVIATISPLPPINFISIYNPPRNNPSFTLDLENLIVLNTITFMAGDFNAKRRTWNCTRGCRIGKQLEHFTLLTGQKIISFDSPIRYDRKEASMIDLAITRNFNYACNATADDELSSDHLPVKFLAEHQH